MKAVKIKDKIYLIKFNPTALRKVFNMSFIYQADYILKYFVLGGYMVDDFTGNIKVLEKIIEDVKEYNGYGTKSNCSK